MIPTANDPETANDPQNGPQMIPWKVEEWNGFYGTDPRQKRTDYKKNLFLSPFQEKGKADATSQVNLYKAKKKKWNKSEKVWY